MSRFMQFIKHENGCAPDSLEVCQTDMPSLSSGQVLVKVACFGLNRADTLQRQGKYPAPAGESDILGLEVSGEIIQFHPEQMSPQQVKNQPFALGDKVFGLVAANCV